MDNIPYAVVAVIAADDDHFFSERYIHYFAREIVRRKVHASGFVHSV